MLEKMSQVRLQQKSTNERLTRQLQWCLQMFEDLQEASLAANRDAVTSSSHIMDIDWSLPRGDDDDDDVTVNDDDVTARNLDNDRNSSTTQWKSSRRKGPDNNRKLSFGFFGRSDVKKESRDSVVVLQDESNVLDRRPPKRFFSQQNLKAIPKDREVCEGYSSRFHPSRFLWRFTSSNQKVKSGPADDGGSSLSLNQQNVPVVEKLLSPEVDYRSPSGDCYPVDEPPFHHWPRREGDGSNYYQTEAAWIGSIERRNRCQSLSVLPEASTTSLLDRHSSTPSAAAAVPSTGSCCAQRPRPGVLGGEFCSSTRCLGEYRPCLNTHYEEPTTGGDSEKQRSLKNGRTHQNWTMQEEEGEREGEGEAVGSMDSYARQMEARLRFGGSSVGDLDLTWSEGPSRSTTTRTIEPDVRSRSRIFPEENGKPPDLVAMATTTNPAQFLVRSPLSTAQLQIERPSGTAIRSDAEKIRDKTALEQDISAQLQGESHARTMRRLSKELYSDRSQSRTLPHSSVLQSPFNKKPPPPQQVSGGENDRQAMNFAVGRSNGFANLPTRTTLSPSTKNPRDQFVETSSRGPNPRDQFFETSSRGPLGYFHSRSLSMSQLQGTAAPSSATRQWSIRDGWDAALTTNTRIESRLSDDSGNYDLIGENRHSFSEFNAAADETRPSLSGVCHQRGGSLDSNEAGRLAYERSSLAPVASRQTHDAETREDFSRSDNTGGTTNRLGYNNEEGRLRPFRYDIYQSHQTSDGDLTLPGKKGSESKQLQLQQQQAMVNLFQKLSAMKHQQKQQQLNGNSTTASYEPSSSQRLSSQQMENPSGSLDKWKSLPHPTTRPCRPVLDLLNRTPDISAKMTDVRSDMLILDNHAGTRSKTPGQQCLVSESGQDLRIIKTELYSESIASPRLSASQTLFSPHSYPPPPSTPPELPPKAAAAAAVAARCPDVGGGGGGGSTCYVDRLRQEAARRQTRSAAVVAVSTRSNSEPNGVIAVGDDRRRRRGGGGGGGDDDDRRHSDDGEELKKKTDIAKNTDHQMASFNNNNNNNNNNRSTGNDAPNDCEYLRKDQSFGENENLQVDEFSKSEIRHNPVIELHGKESDDHRTIILNCLTGNTKKKKEKEKEKTTTEANEDTVAINPNSPYRKFSRCDSLPDGKAKNVHVPSNFQTDGDATRCADRSLLSSLSVLSDSNNRETKKAAGTSTDCLTTQRQHTGTLSDILKDLPDEEEEDEEVEKEEEAYSPEDEEQFRSLSAVLYRHHPDACRILTPVCVRAGASFVRRILFEGHRSPSPDFEGDSSFRAIVDMRSKVGVVHGNGSCESRRESTTSGDSLQTIKDELLAIVEERFQRETEKTEQLTQLHVRTLLLENKVIEFVRAKIDGRQFEKFLSYLEQLEKVVQLFLNLSSRLSSVEETLCQNQGGSSGDDQREQKRYNDKRVQILLRLKEAMDLKRSVDARSEQVCAHLIRHLTPTEFDDFRSLVRNRCRLLIRRQGIDDRKQLIVLQKRFLTDQSSQTGRTKTTCRSVDESNSTTNEKNP